MVCCICWLWVYACSALFFLLFYHLLMGAVYCVTERGATLHRFTWGGLHGSSTRSVINYYASSAPLCVYEFKGTSLLKSKRDQNKITKLSFFIKKNHVVILYKIEDEFREEQLGGSDVCKTLLSVLARLLHTNSWCLWNPRHVCRMNFRQQVMLKNAFPQFVWCKLFLIGSNFGVNLVTFGWSWGWLPA